MHNFQKSYHPPLVKTNAMLKDIELRISRFGHLPLSIRYFYSRVGGVNFAWDFTRHPELRWDLSDPLQIASLDVIHTGVMSEY